jgi:predicted Fe-Mo cluster-binding NifX family protein
MSELKVAISCDDEKVSPHFGRCQKYLIFKIKDGQVIDKEEVLNPGHQPGFLPHFLNQKGVNVLIAGGAGPRAQKILQDLGIETILGISGNVNEVLELYLKGKIEPGQSQCEHEI